MKLGVASAVLAVVSACSDSSSDAGSGYIQLYNAMPTSSNIVLNIDDESYGDYSYNDASTQYLVDGGDYELGFDVTISNSSEQTLSEFEYNITNENISLFVLTGDTDNSEVLKFDYQYEDPETDDEQFTFRILNLAQEFTELDVYIAEEDGSFASAEKLSTTNLFSLTDSFYFDIGEYKFYLTASNSDEVMFESDNISFSYTNQQLIAINPNFGAGQSTLRVDTISSSGSVTEHHNKASNSEVRFYNALITHELFTGYQGLIDVYVDGVDDEPEVSELNQGDASEFFAIEYGDYPLDITNQNDEELTNTQLVSALPNSSVTKFFYITEEEVTDEDDEDTTTTEIYFNSIEAEASTSVSELIHNIQILNFSNDYNAIKIYFVASDETKSTTSNIISGSFSVVSNINLYNDDYDVYVVATEGSSEILLASSTIQLDKDSTNYYLLLEDNNDEQTLNIFAQN